MADEKIEPDEPQETPDMRISEIEYRGMGDVPPIFSDVALVSHQEDMFSLLFFQMEMPSFSGKLKGSTTADSGKAVANCVVRVVLSPTKLHQLHNAMGNNLRRFQKKIQDALEQQQRAESE